MVAPGHHAIVSGKDHCNHCLELVDVEALVGSMLLKNVLRLLF
jgi:hypothetical protein